MNKGISCRAAKEDNSLESPGPSVARMNRLVYVKNVPVKKRPKQILDLALAVSGIFDGYRELRQKELN